MINNSHLLVERLIGKIDNDFNIDNSDWIPRVAAWTIDALSILKVLPMEKKRRELEVVDKIAVFSCPITIKSLKIFDSNGCEISKASSKCCANKSTSFDEFVGVSRQDEDVRYRTVSAKVIGGGNRNYIITGGNKIELNFDTDKITIESLEVATYYDEYFNCDVPYIYDDGLLLEALEWYCMYKMLCRGNKHQVFGLSNHEATNPYLQWMRLKDNASASVISALRRNGKNEGWNNFFYNSTFLPRT